MTRVIAGRLTGRRTKWLVLLFWIVVVMFAGPLAGRLTDVQDNEASSWLPSAAESTKVLQAQAAFQSPDIMPAVVVYARESGLTAADKAKAAADARTFATLDVLDGKVAGPVPSADGKALQTIVPINLGPEGWDRAPDVVGKMRDTARAGANGLAVHITGPAGNTADSADAFAGLDSTLLLAAVLVVVVILLFTYRSPILWLLPVASAGVALATAQAVIYLLAKYADLTVNAQSSGILTVLVFGAGTDYALLLVARYREELRRHVDRHEAMAVALHRAGPAIIASGSTVILGLLCLMVAQINSTSGLGPVTAIGVAIGLLAMITLLPALLVICGRWLFWPVKPRYGSPEPTASGLWARVGDRIARRPRRVWVTTAVVLAALSVAIIDLDARGMTNADAFRGTPDSIVGEQTLARHFPAGAGNPVQVIANAPAAGQVRSEFASTDGITAVTAPRIKNDRAFMVGTLTDAPDSPAANATIDRVRERLHAVPEADAKVGGTTAINLDLQRTAHRDRNLIIPLVLVVVFIILAVLLRAILAPVLLVATVVLSFGAALGISSLAFSYIFGFDDADTSFPLFVFVFLVALGIDYNIFLMSRVREEAARYGTRRGALIGLAATGGVITSAGLVLAGTFAVLGALPLTFLTQLGFAVAVGVLLDTIVVRSVLVTALNLDVGRHMWWPSTLAAKRDVEVAELTEEPAVSPAGPADR